MNEERKASKHEKRRSFRSAARPNEQRRCRRRPEYGAVATRYAKEDTLVKEFHDRELLAAELGSLWYSTTDMIKSPRRHNLLWLVPALLLLAQSLLPVTAFADVSMRCAGMAVATPCARMTVSLTSPRALASLLSQMPCCRAQLSCPMTAQSTQFHLSSGHCLVTVQTRATSRAALMPSSHRWLLRHAPALAPPALPRFSPAAPASVSLSAFHTADFSPPAVSAHGLRAPPHA